MSDRRADAASRHAAVASSRASPRGRSVPPSPLSCCPAAGALSCSSPAAAALSHSLAAKAASPASAARQPSDGLPARGARHSPVRLFDDSDRPHRARKGSAQPDQPLFVPRRTPRTTCSASGPGMLRDTTTVTRRHLLSAVGCEDPTGVSPPASSGDAAGRGPAATPLTAIEPRRRGCPPAASQGVAFPSLSPATSLPAPSPGAALSTTEGAAEGEEAPPRPAPMDMPMSPKARHAKPAAEERLLQQRVASDRPRAASPSVTPLL